DAVAKLSRPSPMRRLAKGFDRVERCEFYFFFQAEDGIRDFHVTGVQTCALPISARELSFPGPPGIERFTESGSGSGDTKRAFGRSEERRVGKECRSRWWPEHEKKNKEWRTDRDATRSGS